MAAKQVSKTAENEAIKLKATFYNNVAVGLMLAGVLIPYLSILQSTPEIEQWLNSVGSVGVTRTELQRIMIFVGSIFVALFVAVIFREHAKKIIEDLT
jgi:hypothetical protein